MTLVSGTSNLDFATAQGSDRLIVNRLVSEGCRYISVVEAKVDNLRAMIPSRWTARQDVTDKARQGCAAAWAKDVRIAAQRPLRVGVKPHGAKMRTRYLLINDVWIDGRRVRRITLHRPPWRFRFLDPLFDRQVRKRLKAVPWSRRGQWAIDGDFNGDGKAYAKKIGGTFHGSGIVGFITGPKVRATSTKVLHDVKARGWTDHPAIVTTLGGKW